VLGALLPELNALRAHPSVVVRTALVHALAAQTREPASALLMDLTQDPAAQVRSMALDALAARSLREQPGWAERLALLARSDPAFWLRERAVRVLGQLPSPAATNTLTHVLATEPYALVRERAVQSLAGRPPQLIASALQRATRDTEARVASAASAALRRCGPACSASTAPR
jgi:HEAT repeat protein